MEQSSRYETILGHLGAYLACQEARRIEIADEGGYVTVSWLSQGATRRSNCFRPEEIVRLQPSGRRDPSDSSSGPPSLECSAASSTRAAWTWPASRRRQTASRSAVRRAGGTRTSASAIGSSGRSDSAPGATTGGQSTVPPPIQAFELTPAMAAVQAEPVAQDARHELTVPAVRPESPAAKSGPATEILSRELRPLPELTSGSPLRRRLQA